MGEDPFTRESPLNNLPQNRLALLGAVKKLIALLSELPVCNYVPMGDRLRKNAVLDYLDELVMATGIAELQADGVSVRVLHLAELTKIEAAGYQSLDDLAVEQGIQPLTDPAELRGELIDDFDEFYGTFGQLDDELRSD